MANPPGRLLNFISEHEVEEIKKRRGEHGEVESTADKPLYEILKANKDKQQAEFNERFKHRPPKALDEDETEFLENMEMHKRLQEKQLASEEALELLNFQAAVASRTISVEDPKSIYQPPKEAKSCEKEKRSTALRPSIVIKTQPKKAKTEKSSCEGDLEKSSVSSHVDKECREKVKCNILATQGLVSYGSDSEEEEE